MHARGGSVFCPECGSQLGDEDVADAGLQAAASYNSPAGRVTAAPSGGVEESPDTAGQDAGASQAAKADGKWNRKETAPGTCLSGDAGGKGEMVG